MISPQEPAGNEYYYPTRGTTRVSVTHPASAYAYWRKRIGDEIADEIREACLARHRKKSGVCGTCAISAYIARGGYES